jgi:hypothetical protein
MEQGFFQAECPSPPMKEIRRSCTFLTIRMSKTPSKDPKTKAITNVMEKVAV